MENQEIENQEIFDVIISGGGLVGLSLAIALESGGMKVAVIDRLPPVKMLEETYDGRSSAIAYANMRMLEVLGIKAELTEFGQIQDILVVDGKVSDGAKRGGARGFTLHFDDDEISETEPLGYMVENRYTRFALDRVAEKRPNITRITGKSYVSHETFGDHVEVTINDGQVFHAKLLVGCDGRGSKVRANAGIKTNKFGYNQTGIVTTVKMEKPHNDVAYEYFLPTGPFAILPLPHNRASIVWCEPHKKAQAMVKLPKEYIESELQKRFGDFLGKVEICTPVFSYPLSMELAADWYRPRVVLCGDAAHGIHPVAGQGFNLGLKDVAAMAEVLTNSRNVGLDIGDEIVLEEYAKWRRTDTMMVAMACDGFVRLFSNDFAPLRFARNLGIGLVDNISPMRKFFCRHAGGDIGDLPKLLRGETLESELA